MSEVKIATRESYGKALTELGKVNPDVIVFDCRPCRCHKDRYF